MFILVAVTYVLKLLKKEKKLTIMVLLFPPSAFFSSLVNTEFLYGTTTSIRTWLLMQITPSVTYLVT